MPADLVAPPEGLLLIDKPVGPTSHDVVSAVRRATGQRRVGHAGTLDPMASGLLPLVLGRATRLVRFLPHSPKLYEGRLRLGVTTDTDDATGTVVRRHGGALPGAADVRAAADALTGRLLQVPPAFSARKVGGRRLYRLSREGRRVEAPPSEVWVHRFELAPGGEAGEWDLVAEVSAGTYIRALARDVGEALGTGAILVSLRRTAIATLRLSSAVGLPDRRDPRAREILGERVIALEEMPLGPATLRLLDARDADRFAAGSALDAPASDEANGEAGLRRVLDSTGRLLGIGAVEEGRLRPRVVVAASRAPATADAVLPGPGACGIVGRAKKEKTEE